jgi:acyl-CoA synthetase (AMP-forming)/AMP-acid ligase II
VGKPGPGVGELPVAFVKLKKGMSANIAGMLNHVNNQVAHYKKLETIITDDIHVSGPGKVFKRRLKERF